MTGVTREWLEKAEADFRSAQRELRARKSPNYDLACFCAQQCAEKTLKARLLVANVRFPKTHDLTSLLKLLLPLDPEWELMREQFACLTDYAVRFRYPGSCASREQAREAVKIAKRIRARVQEILGIVGRPPSRKKQRRT